jgi:hypothetical protein
MPTMLITGISNILLQKVPQRRGIFFAKQFVWTKVYVIIRVAKVRKTAQEQV